MPKRLALAIAAVTAVGAIATTASAAPLPPGSSPNPITTTAQTGNSSTTFGFNPLAAPNNCPGDGVAGYRWAGFITPKANDPSQLRFDDPGGFPNATEAPGSLPLATPGSQFIVAQVPGPGTGFVNAPNSLNFANTLLFNATELPAGEYWMGLACYDLDVPGLPTERYWATDVTVSRPGAGPNNFTWSIGTAPAAPILSLGAGTATTQTINIDNPDATLDSYNLDVSLPLADPLPIVTPGDTSFVLTGLTLGTSYDVELESVKAGFPAATSNTLSFTAAASGPAPVVVAPDVFESTDATISWTVPTVAGIPAPVSFDVTVTGGTTVTPFVGVPGPSVTVPGTELGIGSYTATVTPNYAAGSGLTGTPGSDGFTVNPNSLLYQDITVERPDGALVLTQRCGVFGAFPAFDTTGWPGAQLALDPLPAVAGPGTAPTVVGGPNDGLADPLFSSYPQDGTYPTLCGVDLGEGELVTSGPLAGRYYATDGQINQVTVLDTRDGDLGWTARGDIADLFTSGPAPFDENNSFSGDFLGWFPQVSSASAGQTVTPGPAVGPGTSVGGLTSNPTLASAPAGAGLGVATLDARLALIIPVAADADSYTARLSLTVA
jgi:hypothetical protein